MGAVAAPVQWRELDLAEERRRRRDALDEFTRRLREQVEPTCIILFGSVAKGSDRIESDLDVVVVGGKLPEKISERLRFVARLKRGIAVSIDSFPYTESEFEQMLDDRHVTALDCMYEGVPLHGQDYFERLRPKFEAYVARGLKRDKVAWYFDRKTP